MLRKFVPLLALTLMFAGLGLAPAQAASTYDGTSGVVDCVTTVMFSTNTGTFTITNNVVVSANACAGEATIPVGVTSVGNLAFHNQQLTSVTMPDSVTSIGDFAFSANTLTSVTIPDSVTSIGNFAFWANQLTTVTIPAGVTSIGNYAFSENQLTTVTIPVGVTSIGDYAFAVNQLTAVTIPAGVASIGGGAFSDNLLTAVTIPPSVTSIGSEAFRNNLLTAVTIPPSVTSIGNYAFLSNKLTAVTIPAGVTSIGEAAFGGNLLTAARFLGNMPTDGGSIFDSNSSLLFVDVTNGTTGWGLTFSGVSVRTSYTVTYNSNAGSAITSGLFLPGGAILDSVGAQVTAAPSSTRSGYTFKGWSATNGGSAIEWTYTPSGSANVTLYAKWEVADGDVACSAGGTFTITSSVVVSASACAGEATIPVGVTSIGNFAFYNQQLTAVTISDSVVSVGESAFGRNSQLSSFAVDANNTAFSASAGVLFNKSGTTLIAYPASKGSTYVIPDTITSIGIYAFAETQLTAVTIPAGVTSIGDYAFENNLLSTVNIPAGVISIGNGAFYGNQLTAVTIPDSVVSIGDYAFGSNLLTAARFLGNMPTDGRSIFDSNSSLSFVDVTPGTTGWGLTFSDVTVRPSYTVTYNSNAGSAITSGLFLPGGAILDSVGAQVTAAPSSTRSGYTFKGWSATNGGSAIEWTYTPSGNANVTLYAKWEVADGDVACSAGGTFTITSSVVVSASACAGEATIPAGVTSIGDSAFDSNRLLTAVTIPSGVTSIGDGAFYNTLLTSVTIPVGVTSIGESAFSLNQLTAVTIPVGVTSIGNQAFQNNKLTAVTIPVGVTSIGNSAFSGNRLTAVTIPAGVTSIGNSAFYNNLLTSVTIPDSVTSISDGAFRNNLLTAVTIPAGVTSIGNFAFYYNRLSTVTIPVGVTSIGDYAFYYNQITAVTIPDSVTSIGNGAFYRNQLTAVTIPVGVTSIGTYAFKRNLLTAVTIPDSVTSIGNAAFSENQLTAVTIPVSVTSIGDYAFGSNQLTSVTIPVSVVSIGEGAFEGNQLTAVTIPVSVVSIGDFAFGSNQLTAVTIPAGVTSIGEAAFGSNLLTAARFLGNMPTDGGTIFDSNTSLLSVDVTNGTLGWGEKFSNIAVRTSYTVTYNSNAGSAITSGLFLPNGTILDSVGVQVTAAPSPTRSGYTFAGWALTNGGSAITFPYTEGGSANLTLYAKWTQNLVKASASVKPTITGKAVSTKKGTNKLTAAKGTWSGTPTPVLSFQWYACGTKVTTATERIPSNCKVISTATKTTLAVVSSYKGKFLAVRVTGKGIGTSATSWLSKSTAKVS